MNKEIFVKKLKWGRLVDMNIIKNDLTEIQDSYYAASYRFEQYDSEIEGDQLPFAELDNSFVTLFMSIADNAVHAMNELYSNADKEFLIIIRSKKNDD